MPPIFSASPTQTIEVYSDYIELGTVLGVIYGRIEIKSIDRGTGKGINSALALPIIIFDIFYHIVREIEGIHVKCHRSDLGFCCR
jgi:hypothetical protein